MYSGFFLRKEKLSFASISVRTVSSNNFYAHEKFYFVSMYMKANSLTSDLQRRFRPFCFKSKLQSIRSVGNCKIRYVYTVKSRSIAFRFHHSLVSIGKLSISNVLIGNELDSCTSTVGKYDSEIVDIMKRNTVPKDNLDLYTYIDGIVYYTMFLWYNLLTSITFK